MLAWAASAAAATDATREGRAGAIFSLHYDQHAHAASPGLGAGVEHLAEMFRAVRPAMVQYHSVGHPGYTTYPSRIGAPSAGLQADMLARYSQAARQAGAKFFIYVSTLWNDRVFQQHPEWRRLGPDGKTPTREGWLDHNSRYVDDHLLPLLAELIERYQPDGFWLDGDMWTVLPSWNPDAVAKYRAETGREPPINDMDDGFDHFKHWTLVTSYQTYLRKVSRCIRSRKPSCVLGVNWAYSLRQPEDAPDSIDWLTGDLRLCFGLPEASREGRFLGTRGHPFDIMICNHVHNAHRQGWALKTREHLQQEAAAVIANGGNVFLWDNPLPDGSLDPYTHVVLNRAVRDFVHARAAVMRGSRSVPDTAILHGETGHYRGSGHSDAIEGAWLALTRDHWHFDIINEAALARRLDEYRVVFVPEQRHVPKATWKRLRAFVKAGGGLAVALDWQDLPPVAQHLLGVKLEGPSLWDNELPSDTGRTPLGIVYEVSLAGAQVHRHAVRRGQELPLVTLRRLGRGRVVTVLTPLCRRIKALPHPALRALVSEAVRMARGGSRLVDAQAPSCVEVTVRDQGARRIVHLVNHAPGRPVQGADLVVRRVPTIRGVRLRLEAAQEPSRVTLEPAGRALPWTWKRGHLLVGLPKLHIHAAVVVE